MQLIWDEFLKIIKAEAGSQVVETWFKAVCLESWDPANSIATLRVPNQFVCRWIQDHYTELLKTHLSRLLNTHTMRLSFEVTPQQEVTPRARNIMPASVIHDAELVDEAAPYAQRLPTIVSQQSEELILSDRAKKQRPGSVINPAYQFDNFVVGPSNSLAHAAAYAICENIGKVYNPLFIYGGTGLGKTHLLHAIGNEVSKRNSELVVRYETADAFINDFINSIRFDRSVQFRSRYQNVDLILFDDIQFLSNKEQTQESFFHIFNMLYEHQKQIVLSSDTFPKEIHGLQSRLKSRMEWGLVADIQTPDIETKIAILNRKSDLHSISLPEDVAEFIASRVVSNIRELEGALIRIGAFASLTNQQISLEMARKVLLNLNEPKREGIMLDAIIKVVAKQYSTGINDIRSKKRHQDISLVRQITFYLMKKMSNCSLQVIGSYVGGRDHSTVIHAVSKVEQLLKADQALGVKIKAMEQEILQS